MENSFDNVTDPQSQFGAWKQSMDELVGSFYQNSRQPSSDEIMSVLSDKMDELSSLITSVGETGLDVPNFENIITQIRTSLETSQIRRQVNIFA